MRFSSSAAVAPRGRRARRAKSALAALLLASWALGAAFSCGLLAGVARAEEPGAVRLELDREAVPAGGAVSGRILGAPPGQALRLAWVDALGRVISDAEVERDRKERLSLPVRFSVTVEGFLGRSHRLVALVAPQSAKRDAPRAWHVAAEASFQIQPAPEPWLDYLAITGPSRDREGAAETPLTDARGSDALLGVRGVFLDTAAISDQTRGTWATGTTPFLADCACRNLGSGHPFHPLDAVEWAAFQTEFLASHRLKPRATPLFGETAWARLRAELAVSAQRIAGLGALGYSLGDQPSLGLGVLPYDFEPTPETLAVYREWLQTRYSHLSLLNAQWGTAFAGWEEVRPPTTDECLADHNPRYAAWLEMLFKGDPDKKLPRRDGRPYFEVRPDETRPGGENFSGWCDYREFLDFAFARMLKEAGAAVRQVDPQARVGFTGGPPPSAWGGADWSRLSQTVDWAALPPGATAGELLRCLRPGLLRLSQLACDDPNLKTRLWQDWMRGARGALLTGPEALSAAAAGNLTPPGEALAAELRDLSGGLTLQRSLAREVLAPVALYYSPRSFALHWRLDTRGDGAEWIRHGDPGRGQDTPLLALEAWLALLSDLGYTPTIVHPEQLLAGNLNARVLILPKVLALSDREALALRSFVAKGGVVVADSQCGLFDAAGQRYALTPGGGPTGLLDREFGLSRTDFRAFEVNGAFTGDPKEARVTLEDPARPVALGPSSSELRINEPGLTATGAWRYGRTGGGAAAVLVRSGGKGRFCYLNLAIQDYPTLRLQARTDFSLTGMDAARYAHRYGEPTGGEALRVLLADMFSEALGAPLVSVRSPAGVPLHGVEARRWSDGPLALIALLPNSGGLSPTDVQVVFTGRLHWYDSRRGLYLGLGTGCQTRLERGQVAVLAALPYRVKRISAKVRRLDPRGTFKVEASLVTSGEGAEGSSSAGRHVFHVQVFAPDDRLLPAYTRNVVAKEGEWTGVFTLGLNEPGGYYRWVIRDALTGATTAVKSLKESADYQDLFPPPGGYFTKVPEPGAPREVAPPEVPATPKVEAPPATPKVTPRPAVTPAPPETPKVAPTPAVSMVPLSIGLDADGNPSLGGLPISLAELSDVLEASGRQAVQPEVLVQADSKTPYQKIAPILELARKFGLKRVNMKGVPPPPLTPPPPAPPETPKPVTPPETPAVTPQPVVPPQPPAVPETPKAVTPPETPAVTPQPVVPPQPPAVPETPKAAPPAPANVPPLTIEMDAQGNPTYGKQPVTVKELRDLLQGAGDQDVKPAVVIKADPKTPDTRIAPILQLCRQCGLTNVSTQRTSPRAPPISPKPATPPETPKAPTQPLVAPQPPAPATPPETPKAPTQPLVAPQPPAPATPPETPKAPVQPLVTPQPPAPPTPPETPKAPPAPGVTMVPLVIGMDADGNLTLGDLPISQAELNDILTAAGQQAVQPEVIVRPAAKTPLPLVADLLATGRKCGLKDLSVRSAPAPLKPLP